MEYYSAIKGTRTVLMRWRNLEPIIQSEVSQRKTSYVNVYMWNLEKWYWWTYLPGSCGDADIREQTCWHSGDCRGWDELRERHWKVYTTICKIDSQWEFAVWCRELKLCALWQPREVRWGGMWDGGSRVRGHSVPMAGKNQHNITKQLFSN